MGMGGAARAVLWDLDGTLVDSEELHWLSWRDTMAAEGQPITHAQFREMFGQRNDRILGRWLGSDVPADRMIRIGDAKEELYRQLIVTRGLTPLPGAAEWLARLHRGGWKQAIASSAPRENVRVMLNVLGIEQEIDAVASAEEVPLGKPDPQVFLTAAARLRVPPARCIVVEDAAVGIEAARRGGMKSIAVGGGAGPDADVTVRSLSDLADNAFERLVP